MKKEKGPEVEYCWRCGKILTDEQVFRGQDQCDNCLVLFGIDDDFI